MGNNDDAGLLEPRLPVHLHGELVRAVHGNLGVATLRDSLVLDPEDFGRGYLGDARDPHDLYQLVVVGRSRKALREKERERGSNKKVLIMLATKKFARGNVKFNARTQNAQFFYQYFH